MGPLVYWRAKRRRRASEPAEEPTDQKLAVLDEYRTSPDLRMRRWLFFTLPIVGGLLGFVAANFLFDANGLTWVAALWGVGLGMFLAGRWFSAGG